MLSEESISVLRQLLDACMEMCSIREPNILENLGTLESDLARLYPRFRDMKEIKVFVRYGLAHRTIYDKACEAGMEATCWYDPMEEPTGFLILRMLNLNPNVAVPDEFILRMTIENAIEAALVKKLQKTRRELSSGLGYTLAKQYMEGKPTDELLRIFEAGRTLETSEAIQVLAMRDDLRQLWEQATIL